MKIIIDTNAKIQLTKQDAKDFYAELNHILIMNCGDELPVTKRVKELMEGVAA